jgi:hypothetical protein
MTLTMLPPAPKDVGRLSDVFISALGAITGGENNRLKLPRVESALVVLIDGLGYQNLKDHAGHARKLHSLLVASGDKSIRCGFPSTTAVSLTSFGTGIEAGSHGILGYQVLGDNGSARNMLNGWAADEDPRLWQRSATVTDIAKKGGVQVNMIATSEYAGSGFTKVFMSDVTYEPVDDLGERARAANRLAAKKNSLSYLYFAELDQAAHRFGVNSPQWIATLEAIDAAIQELTGNYGLLITADHGILDVAQANQVFVDAIPGFSAAVTHAIGDPRALFCYGDVDKARQAISSAGVPGYLTSFAELIELGWVTGQVTRDRVPDFVLIAKGETAFYDRRTAKKQSLLMVGQHGGISDVEMRIPLIRGGLFA